MDQVEIDANNRMILSEFLKAIAPGELVAAVVTLRRDVIGWYPVVASQSGEILDLLRKKPDEVHIEIRR